ncbi:MAG TPA: peptide chain release factor N(5)-glutamine methyltransferase [Planctomycetaceae bacterium]|nr:peptide chain release factor N(5)-glutamine methyltransferase [Planctomycetaceae bacterium]HRF00007.1 peptide chain release factor N(5)-glutamine methyltransferase [Pirellulaceae bacterium]
MTTEEVWTVKRLLEWTTDYLARSGADSPRLDAEILLGKALGWPRIQLYARYDAIPSDDERTCFRESIKRRAKGMPVAYLTGEREFFSLPFEVSPAVLIPRPETEFVVVGVLDALKKREGGAPTLLDIGTGSGAIAVAVAKHDSRVRVTAVDRSAAALDVARRNAARHGLAERIEFRCSDLFQACGEERFDIIASNPPYIGEREKDSLSVDVRDHEPHEALFSGDDGTDLTRRLIAEAPQHLLPAGLLIFETSPLIAERLVEALNADGRYEAISVRKDLAGLPRVVSARVASK